MDPRRDQYENDHQNGQSIVFPKQKNLFHPFIYFPQQLFMRRENLFLWVSSSFINCIEDHSIFAAEPGMDNGKPKLII
jgi:hypothetical protein